MLIKNVSVTDVTYRATCFNVSFHDHGPRTECSNFYMDFYDLTFCHEQCRNDEQCFGYTYDGYICKLNGDKNFITGSPCSNCRFYEKTCHSCKYKSPFKQNTAHK